MQQAFWTDTKESCLPLGALVLVLGVSSGCCNRRSEVDAGRENAPEGSADRTPRFTTKFFSNLEVGSEVLVVCLMDQEMPFCSLESNACVREDGVVSVRPGSARPSCPFPFFVFFLIKSLLRHPFSCIIVELYKTFCLYLCILALVLFTVNTLWQRVSVKPGLWASVETGLVGQAKLGLWARRNWAYGPMRKLGFRANVETGLTDQAKTRLRGQRIWAYGPGEAGLCGPVWKLGLWARRAGLMGQYGNWAYGPARQNWAYGPIWKLGLWASVETGLIGASVETGFNGPIWKLGLWARRNWAYGPTKLGLWTRQNWAYGPIWKLGLWASVETGLMGASVETRLNGPIWKLGLWARRNWAYGPDETERMGQTKLGLRGPKLGLWARRNWAYEILKLPDETELLKCWDRHRGTTFLKGNVISEFQDKHDTPKTLPRFRVWEKRMTISNGIRKAAPVSGLWVDGLQGEDAW
ncbi:hypothetical protein V8G54_023326 [Vigna mungo]|uniref:Uncharacterized protein n=1 Tax=Vigna mungo TaxID=3915 RepID=A0AAQ3N2Y4_VIGMU